MTISVKLQRAVSLHQSGNLDEAEALYRSILAADGRHFDALHLLGLIQGQRNRHDEAARLIGAALDVNPSSAPALVNHAIALMSLGRLGEALAALERVLSLPGSHADALYHRGNLLLAMGRPEAALASYDRLLALVPGHPEGTANRGNALMALGQPAGALDCFETAIRLRPEAPGLRNNSGQALLSLDKPRDALRRFLAAVALAPDFADAWAGLSRAHLAMSHDDGALEGADRALAIAPDSTAALVGRGLALVMCGRAREAAASFRKATALAPAHIDALTHRGTALARDGALDAALADYSRALAVKPDHVDALYNRANALIRLLRPKEAIAGYDATLAIEPAHSLAHSNKIYALDFVEGLGFEAHQAERRRWFRMQASRIPVDAKHPNVRDPDRRLIVGHVSADFRTHSAAFAFGPVLRRLDRSRFEVVLYSNSRMEDALTRDFRAGADRWRRVADLTDDELAQRIRDDGIDILVDLSGHTDGNRLLMFARKPAPIQVTAWGYSTGTGIPAIDYLFHDTIGVPTSARPLFAETIADLPCQVGFEAPPDSPGIGASPATTRGYVTFGCFNRLFKVSAGAIELWSKILHALPRSRLLLKDRLLDLAAPRATMIEAFARRGFGTDRLELLGNTSRREHLQAHDRIDIALDPFPHNGGVSTWEALWMGCPVVAKTGNSIPGRMSAAILASVGLNDWVAGSDEEYVAIALRKAGDIEGLTSLRSRLRGLIEASESGNPDRYANAVGEAYRAMWRRWCAR